MSWFSSLFSPSKTISVSSSVYNLAGDQNKRPDFLQTTVLGAVLGTSDLSTSEQIIQSYLTGPGIQLRSFASWARTYGYDTLVGISATPISLVTGVSSATLAPLLPTVAGYSLMLQTASIGLADYTVWVDQYMVTHYPSLLNTAYTCDYNSATNVATITLVGGTVVTFTLTGYNPNGVYLYATYNYGIPGVPGVPAIPASAGPPVVTYVPAVPAIPPVYTPLQYLIYQKGTGNSAMDALFATSTDAGYFLPYIPIMVNKNFISKTYMPTVYPQCVKAVKKALNASYDDIVTKVKANSSIGNIDYVYIVFGVSLNVLENSCRNYVYQFFLDVMTGLDLSSPAFTTWQTAWEAADASMVVWATWQVAQSNPASPLYMTTAPTVIPYPAAPKYQVQVSSSTNAILDYNMTISWAGLVETRGTGLKKSSAKKGDLWFEVVSNTPINASAYVNAAVGTLSYTQTQTHIRLNWQVDVNNWRCLDIYNLTHTNLIYSGKAVVTQATDALASANESGFIIPLNEGMYRTMTLADSTQMATACCFLVFNSYSVVTAPWYTAGFFQVLLIVVVIAITVTTGNAESIGLLGMNAAVGAAMGLSGSAAAILGAVTNALAAMVLIKLVSIGSTVVFGPKIGAIVGAIAGVLALQVGMALANGMTSVDLLNTLSQPMNLLKLSIAAGNGYSQFMQIETQDILKQTQDMLTSYNTASKALEDQYQTMLGTGSGADLTINPLALTDVNLPNVKPNIVLAESPQSFFDRTLISGSDIADLSMKFVTNFCDATISTTLPGQTA